MIRKRLILYLLFCFSAVSLLNAQSRISGRVTNKSGLPLKANVSIKEKGSSLISSFTMTDDNGEFALEYSGGKDSLALTVSGMTIGKYEKHIPNISHRYDIKVEEKSVKLKEVTVKALKITQEKDTLNYLVSAFADQNDRVIANVLKKMPGIEVADDGKISFNGKAVSKFYIEGMDLLQGKYGIATNNMPTKSVSLVQVLKNHQPVKVLQDKQPSDAVAINIRLKDEAKGVFIFSGMLGAGYQPFLWAAEANGMLFGKTYQTMTAYKGNNAGDNVTNEFKSHYGNDGETGSSGNMLRVQGPSMPNISSKRYSRNNSHAISTNHLNKLKRGGEWTTGVTYYNDKIEKEGMSVTEQYLPGGDKLMIEEKLSSINYMHNLGVTSRININDKEKYINDKFYVNANWNEDFGTGIVSGSNRHVRSVVNQHLDRPLLSLGNSFNMIKEIGKSTYNAFLNASYNEEPHTLSVSPVDYWEGVTIDSLSQNLLMRRIKVDAVLSYGLKLKNFYLDYSLCGNADFQNMESDMDGNVPASGPDFSDKMWRNDLWYNDLRTGIMQSYSFKTDYIRISLSLPLMYYRLAVDDRLRPDLKTYHKLLFTPSFSLNYKPDNWGVNIQGSYMNNFGGISSAYSGYVMQGYRNLLSNEMDKLLENRQLRFTGGIEYENAFNYLFFNAGGGVIRNWRNLLYGYSYSGIMRVKQTLDYATVSDTYSGKFSLRKGFDFCNFSLQLSGQYMQQNSKQLIQDEVLDFVSQNVAVSVGGYMAPASFLSADYSCDFSWSRSYAPENSGIFSTVKSVLQKFNLNLFPMPSLTFNFGLEYQYTNLASTKNMLFSDLRVKWRRGKIEMELEANNLFNDKKYMRVFYNGTSMYRYSCDLRPVNVLVKVRYSFK